MRRVTIAGVSIIVLAVLGYLYASGPGDFLAPAIAAPDTVIPADSTLFVDINRDSNQWSALRHVQAAYRSSVTTQAALETLQGTMFGGSRIDLASVMNTLGDHLSVAYINTKTKLGVSEILAVQLKLSDQFSGQGPLTGIATTVAYETYLGTTIDRVLFHFSSTRYFSCVVHGVGILGQSVAAVRRVIDVATGGAPSLTTNATYLKTIAHLPASRIVTVYASQALVAHGLRDMHSNESLAALVPMIASQPMGLAVLAKVNQLEVISTPISATVSAGEVTPNYAASIVSSDAVAYYSTNNIGSPIKAAILATNPLVLVGSELSTGIDINSDVLPLMRNEFGIALTSRGSDLKATLQQLHSTGVQGLPKAVAHEVSDGSLDVVLNMGDPIVAQSDITRIMDALATGIAYRYRHPWLIMSTLPPSSAMGENDTLAQAKVFKKGLAGLTYGKDYTNVGYVNVRQLLDLVDSWMQPAQGWHSGMRDLNGTVWKWSSVRPLISPLADVVIVRHRIADDKASFDMVVQLST